MSDLETMRKAVASYGARLGIVEPLARSTFSQLPKLRSILDDLRASKQFGPADRLRKVIVEIEVDAAYAFPSDAKSKWGCK